MFKKQKNNNKAMEINIKTPFVPPCEGPQKNSQKGDSYRQITKAIVATLTPSHQRWN